MEYFKADRIRPLFKRMLEHVERNEPTLAADMMRIPVNEYFDQERWDAEVDRIFRRRPQLLALSSELREPGSYRATTIAGVPILLTRLRNGEVRLFVNACRHRGVPVVAEGDGRASRFTCVYHAWTYATDGKLLALPDQDMFGDIDKNCFGLTPLAVEERDGMIWGMLSPGVTLDLDDWLGEMGPLLADTDLSKFSVFEQRILDSNNWKITFEGYIETYHFASLHRDSFAQFFMPNLTVYDAFGRHFRLCVPIRGIEQFKSGESSEDEMRQFLQHSIALFPSTQLSFIDRTPEVPVTRILMSQVFPGNVPGTSKTILRTLVSHDVRGVPYEESVTDWSQFTMKTVEEEDYPVVKTIQSTLKSGANDFFIIGRNEIGIHHMHDRINEILAEDTVADD